MINEENLSACCAYPIYDDTDICSRCKDHTAPLEEDEGCCSDCTEETHCEYCWEYEEPES